MDVEHDGADDTAVGISQGNTIIEVGFEHGGEGAHVDTPIVLSQDIAYE